MDTNNKAKRYNEEFIVLMPILGKQNGSLP
jgi:hypothetical protein